MHVSLTIVLATRRKSRVSVTLFIRLLGAIVRLSSRLFVVSTHPRSAIGTMSIVFSLASPEYLNEFSPVRLFGSVVNRAPALPIRLRPQAFCVTMKHEVSRTIGQSRSGDTFAMA